MSGLYPTGYLHVGHSFQAKLQSLRSIRINFLGTSKSNTRLHFLSDNMSHSKQTFLHALYSLHLIFSIGIFNHLISTIKDLIYWLQ